MTVFGLNKFVLLRDLNCYCCDIVHGISLDSTCVGVEYTELNKSILIYSSLSFSFDRTS